MIICCTCKPLIGMENCDLIGSTYSKYYLHTILCILWKLCCIKIIYSIYIIHIYNLVRNRVVITNRDKVGKKRKKCAIVCQSNDAEML